MDPDQEQTYRAAVKRLTAENKQLQHELRDERRRCRAEAAVLSAQLREGLLPELIILRNELSRWRARALAAEARVRQQITERKPT